MSKLMSKNILSSIILGMMLMLFVVPAFAMAQTGGNPPTGGGNPSTKISSGPIVIKNPFKQDTIQGLIKTIVDDILIPIGAVVAVIMIMYAGFLFVTAGGDPGKIKKAKEALLYAVIGAAILLGAWIISTAIQTTVEQLKI